MESIRNSILKHVRVNIWTSPRTFRLDKNKNELKRLFRLFCSSTVTDTDQITDRVISLVKKFDRIDACKVNDTADFQKDLNLDSLDRVELVMAFEQEFSIEIPDKEADKLTCCADVAKYIISATEKKN